MRLSHSGGCERCSHYGTGIRLALGGQTHSWKTLSWYCPDRHGRARRQEGELSEWDTAVNKLELSHPSHLSSLDWFARQTLTEAATVTHSHTVVLSSRPSPTGLLRRGVCEQHPLTRTAPKLALLTTQRGQKGKCPQCKRVNLHRESIRQLSTRELSQPFH